MKIKKMSKASVLLIVLLIAVGFAAISTTLNIIGKTTVGSNSADFESKVVFATATGTNYKTATVSADGKSITFETNTLVNINDTSVLTYTIKNSSQYGASIPVVTCTSEDTSFAEYIEVVPSRTTDLSLEKGTTSASESLTFKLIKSYAEEDPKDITFTCSIEATAISAAE